MIQQVRRPHRITFLGALHWPPNAEGVLWFVHEVWPFVQQQAPNAVLTIIGKHPPAEIRNLYVTGYVPDPTPYLAETAAFVVPLFAAGGMRVKILDAWSWGLPIVSTTIGAEGIDYRDGENILIADEPEQFAAAICRLLTCPELAGMLRTNGRRWVEQHYDWRKMYRQWDEVYVRYLPPLRRAL